MTQEEIESIFYKRFGGRTNFLTPNVLEYVEAGQYICEISSSVSGRTFGVTVLDFNGCDTGLSKALHSLTEAKEYVKSL